MNLTQFFDTSNRVHVEAYLFLMNHGTWSQSWINLTTENAIEFENNWQFSLMNKLSIEYINLLSHTQK